MKPATAILGPCLVALLALTGCVESGGGFGAAPQSAAMVAASWRVARIDVQVPHTLRVSEENRLIPNGDIVWHGDATGDRYAQVQSIMTEAARRGTAGMVSGPSVVVSIEITRFHALSPRARYTTGGNFATRFILTVKDARTGAVLDGPRVVMADCPASGGDKALREEAQGITQRMVIVDHVSGVIRDELSHRLATAAQ